MLVNHADTTGGGMGHVRELTCAGHPPVVLVPQDPEDPEAGKEDAEDLKDEPAEEIGPASTTIAAAQLHHDCTTTVAS